MTDSVGTQPTPSPLPENIIFNGWINYFSAWEQVISKIVSNAWHLQLEGL